MNDIAKYRPVLPAGDLFGTARSIYELLAKSAPAEGPTLALDPRDAGDALLALREGFDGWERRLNDYGRIFVPSDWMGERLSSVYGMRTPISKVKVGVDTSIFTPIRRKRNPRLRVLFFAAHGDQLRKGVDLAKSAFSAAFGVREEFELVIHSSYPAPMLHKNAPNINIIGGRMQNDEYVRYLHSFDALLFTSRAESVGMTMLEAAATGMPVIHTGATGMAEYGDVGMRVSHRSIRCSDGGEWREGYLDDWVDRLRELNTDYKNVMTRAAASVKTLPDNITSIVSEDAAHGEPPADTHIPPAI